MNSEYKEKLVLLQKIIHDGIGKLLNEAKKKEFLEAPYGRAAFPTPLITEDEFIGDGALQADDVEPEFKFEYGFDPLKFLAEFIIWSHPNSVEDRRQKKIDASLFLQRRADHARKQVYISQTLAMLAHDQSSGILWGPFTSPIDCRTIICSCKPLKFGKVIIQLSKFRDFREIIEKQEVPVDTITDSETPTLKDIFPVKATFKGLKPATKYFIRCCLSSNPHIKVIPPRKPGDSQLEPPAEEDEDVEGLLFKGVKGGCFRTSEFWTLPSEDRSQAEAIVQEEPSTSTAGHEHRSHHGHHHGHHHHHHGHHHKKSAEEAVETTDPSDEFAPVILNCFGQLPVAAYTGAIGPSSSAPAPHQTTAPPLRVDPYCPSVTCLLGDIITKVDSAIAPEDEEEALQAKRYELLQNISKVLARCPLTTVPQTSLRASSFILGWRDSSEGSNYALRAEELAYKQYRQEVKRHKKKYAKAKSSTSGNSATAAVHIPPPPTISRLPFTDSVRSILQGLPINPELFFDPIPEPPPAPAGGAKNKPNAAAQAAAAAAAAQAAMENIKACRMMYRTVMLGPDVVLIVLDMRGQGIAGDYLGSEQAAWLDIVLQESMTIQWKIILCGKTFGLINIQGGETEPEVQVESAEGTVLLEEGEGMPSELSTVDEATAAVAEMTILEGISEDKEMELSPEASAPSKQVQLPHVEDKNHAAITAAISEGIEDGYGRSVCSLQHVLAVHQSRLNQGLYSIPTSAGTKVVNLTSGIVLLTSGQVSVSQHLVSTPAMHHHSEQRDVAAPAFVTGYMNLSAPSANTASDIEGQLLPPKSEVTRRIPSQLFCAEVSLGSTCLPVKPVSASGSRKTAPPEFYYRDGFDARTIYSALGDESNAVASDPSGLGSVAYCNLILQTNGQLQLRLFSADAASKGTCNAVPIFDCVLEAPIPEDENEDEPED